MTSVDAAALFPLLSAVLQADKNARETAERRVEELKVYPGFCAGLVAITLESGAAQEVRQLSALVLKQFIKAHWSDGEDEDELGVTDATTSAPKITVSDAEKASVRAALPKGLADPSTRMRTAISMAIASIAQWDWPDDWPTLMNELIHPLRWVTAAPDAHPSSASSPSDDAASGVLRCLELCAADLQEDHVGEALKSLMPLLLAFVTGRGSMHRVSARALACPAQAPRAPLHAVRRRAKRAQAAKGSHCRVGRRGPRASGARRATRARRSTIARSNWLSYGYCITSFLRRPSPCTPTLALSRAARRPPPPRCEGARGAYARDQ